jgi:2'-5' RNA ligase
MRCFIAIEVPDAWRRALSSIRDSTERAPREIRWVSPQQYHFTLRFLGTTADQLVPEIGDAIAQSARGITPFALRLAGVGTFPPSGAARVLWAGIDDASGACRRWVEIAAPGLNALGFAPEARECQPHITLARAKSPGGAHRLRRIAETATDPPQLAFDVSALTLFESRLSPHGARYHRLSRIPLAGT